MQLISKGHDCSQAGIDKVADQLKERRKRIWCRDQGSNSTTFAAVHESAIGTKRTWRSHSTMSAIGGKADMASTRVNVRL